MIHITRCLSRQAVSALLCIIAATFLTGCAGVEQLQPSLDVIEAASDILSENDIEAAAAWSEATKPVTATKAQPIPADLWVYLGRNFQLTQHKDHPRVKAEIARLQKHPQIVSRIAANAEPFLYYLVQQLEARNLPLDLALLPAIESAYDPLAYSAGRAAGMWQFIESTGEMYDLHQTWWYDDRRDIVASTDAALQYLHDLNIALKGDWLHAIAAYNAGPNRIRRDIRSSIDATGSNDFWSLQVPKETRRYVPKLIALAAVIESPASYGFTLPKLEQKAYFEIVDAKIQLKLHTVADYLAVKPQVIYDLNPGYNQHYTAPDGPHRLLIPAAKKDKLAAMLAGIAAENYRGEIIHRVAKGETLSHIASDYGVSITKLCRWNNIRRNKVLSIGTELRVKEGHNMGIETVSLGRRAYTRKVTYKVRVGDSLSGIAQKFKVSVADLKTWNSQKLTDKHYLYPGENIRLFVDLTKVF